MKLSVRLPRPAEAVSWLLLTFLVLFPKGGIKVASAPVTWGYAILGISFVPMLLIRTLVLPLRASKLGVAAMGSLLPFQLVFCLSFLQNGMDNAANTLSVFVNFFFVPLVFLLMLPSFLGLIDPEKFRRHLCFCILAAALWGIFLFFYHPIMGKYIEIPFLTVNYADYGLLEATKHIDRGGYLKLISTYNNGNVYGVATLILLPLYLKLEPALWKRNVVRVALVLTLSRTVWLGLILEQGLSFASQIPAMMSRFPKIRPGAAMKQGIVLGATVALVFGGLIFNANGLAFLFNSGLGGREGELAMVANPTLLPSIPVGGFSELMYASALHSYGILGFFTFLLVFAAPLLLMLWKPHLLNVPSRRAGAKGVILYAMVAAIDGATNLIPVMAFYWFAYMTMLFGLPGERYAEPVPAPVPGSRELAAT